MKDRKDCKIVQDLLPNYIENLTNAETNGFIEEHLKECIGCNKIYENMKLELSDEQKNNNKKEVDYFKKYKRRMGQLKTIICIIFLIVLVILERRTVILSILSQRADRSKESTNYYSKYSQLSGDEIFVNETYRKGDKMIRRDYHYNIKDLANQTSTISYFDGNKMNYYLTTKDGKKQATLNVDWEPLGGWIDTNMATAYTISHFDAICFIKTVLVSPVRTVNCNGRECYYFSNYQNYGSISEAKGGLYIDKETGLPVRCPGGTIQTLRKTFDEILEYEFKFDVVTDEDVVEPDISEYEIQK